MVINSINGMSLNEWMKECSFESKQYIKIDTSKFDKESLRLGLELGLFTYLKQN